ncbi:uncharacterized protein TNCV_4760451 [Trichonephila clavipes]|uniref:Uncharacterized protein n=1 Tax=Trichonephila clavipes TaxID=2585209 RepID=A0A8X6UUI6_TRICX|nr:uncharacterized protein TNCV_4760451 [Trichonephila clavipes]
MLYVTKYPPSAHGFTCRNCGGGDRGRVAFYRPFGEVSLSLNRTVTCMVLKANDRRTSCPCHDEFRGPRSDYVRQGQNTGFPSSHKTSSQCPAVLLPPSLITFQAVKPLKGEEDFRKVTKWLKPIVKPPNVNLFRLDLTRDWSLDRLLHSISGSE